MSNIIYKSINPVNNQLIKAFTTTTAERLEEILHESFLKFNHNKKEHGLLALESRFAKLESLKKIVADNRTKIADLATLEMGKPIS